MSNKEQIALDSKAVEVLKEAVGGGGSQGGASPYVLANQDLNDIVLGKHIDVTELINTLISVDATFSQLSMDDFAWINLISTSKQIGTEDMVILLRFELDSDNNTEIYVNGTLLTAVSSTKNLIEILTLEKTDIEAITLESLYTTGSGLTDAFIGTMGCITPDTITPYPYSNLKSIFKEVTTEQTI